MTTNQKAGKQSGCKGRTRNVDEGIGSILEDLEAYICDKLCFCNNRQLTQEERDQYCSICRMHDKVDDIEAEYEKINKFDNSSTYQLMKRYKEIVLCEECAYMMDLSDGMYCKNVNGLCGTLKSGCGCSHGIKGE